MKTVLLSAYACDPLKGSEEGNGFNWAIGLQRAGYTVYCLTKPVARNKIEKMELPEGLHFIFISLPFGLDKLYTFSRATMYLHYLLWQWLAYRKALSLCKKIQFDVAHHVTWGSLQLGSFLYKLKVPFIFGPAGGGQSAPENFKEYFKEYWSVEVKREKTSKWLSRVNPGYRPMLRKASKLLFSNIETNTLAIQQGAKNTEVVLDVALPDSFFPKELTERVEKKGLQLLWVGRLLPRKGILLVTEVMETLKAFPDITLTIVGDGEMRDHLLADIKNRSLTNVNYLGAVPYAQVKEFYKSHEAFFFTSLRDSCPAQLFEAMAYGLPVVTLQLHGQDAIVNENVGIKIAVSTPKATVEALKSAILHLYQNKSLVQKMSNAAFEYAKQRTWEQQINSITKLYYP